MSEVSGIDITVIDQLRELMGEDFIGQLVDTYCDEIPQLIVQLRLALAAGDAVTFRRASHSIKSSSLSLGITGLAEMVGELEELGKEEHIAGLEQALDRLDAEYQVVRRVLQAL